MKDGFLFIVFIEGYDLISLPSKCKVMYMHAKGCKEMVVISLLMQRNA